MKLSTLKTNPNNPRLIKDDKFHKLVKSLETFPQMMELRPIIVDENKYFTLNDLEIEYETYLELLKDREQISVDEWKEKTTWQLHKYVVQVRDKIKEK